MDETSKNHESLQNEADNLTFEKFENYYNNLKDRDRNSNFNKNKKKEMVKKQKQYKNSYIYGFIFVIFSVVFEIAGFVGLGLGMLPSNFGIGLGFITIIAAVIFALPGKALRFFITTVILFLQAVLNTINVSTYESTGKMLNFGTDVFANISMNAVLINATIFVVYLLCLFLGAKLMPKFKIKKNKSATLALIALLLTVLSLGVGLFAFFQKEAFADNAKYLMEDGKYIYSRSINNLATYKKYGSLCYFGNKLFGSAKVNLSNDEKKELENEINAGKDYTITDSLFNGNNVSGLLSGDNLIILSLTGIDDVAIDPHNTPKLYEYFKLSGVKFQYYGTDYLENENPVLMGSEVYNQTLKTFFANKQKIDNVQSMAKIFKNSNYDYTTYLINANKLDTEYYAALGFNNALSVSSINNDLSGQSEYNDERFIEKYKSRIAPTTGKFFTYISTSDILKNIGNQKGIYSSYYTKFDSNYSKYVSYVRNNNLGYITPESRTEEYELLREYKARAMAVEAALNIIENYLKTNRDKNNNLLWNNTDIVLIGEVATKNVLNMEFGNNNEFARDKMLAPFAIYSSKLSANNSTKKMTYMDVFPTLCDLFGLSYNSKLVLGNSIFTTNDNLYVNSRVSFNDDFYTFTYDDYMAKDDSLTTNSKLIEFKQMLDGYLKKQQKIENYYFG